MKTFSPLSHAEVGNHPEMMPIIVCLIGVTAFMFQLGSNIVYES